MSRWRRQLNRRRRWGLDTVRRERERTVFALERRAHVNGEVNTKIASCKSTPGIAVVTIGPMLFADHRCLALRAAGHPTAICQRCYAAIRSLLPLAAAGMLVI